VRGDLSQGSDRADAHTLAAQHGLTAQDLTDLVDVGILRVHVDASGKKSIDGLGVKKVGAIGTVHSNDGVALKI
jgi:hypothetical protein